MAKKSAISGEYIITIWDSGTVRVLQIPDNVKESLRKCCDDNKIEYDPNWTTRQFGNKLIKEFGKKMEDTNEDGSDFSIFGNGKSATIGEYTIVKIESAIQEKNGKIETYRNPKSVIAELRIISEKVGFKLDEDEAIHEEKMKKINTRSLGSKLVDFINANK